MNGTNEQPRTYRDAPTVIDYRTTLVRNAHGQFEGSHTIEERFWSKVDAWGDCWEWLGGRDKDDYGLFNPLPQKPMRAHRFAWETLVGLIQEGYVLDHQCRNHRCVNPDHLRPMSSVKNNAIGYSPMAINARKSHCLRGHPLSGDNLYLPADGSRQCKKCQRVALRRWRMNRKVQTQEVRGA